MSLERGTKPIEYYKDANGTHPLFDLEVYGVSSFAKTLLDDTSASEMRNTLNVMSADNTQPLLPIGTILMYDGTGIADVSTRTEDIGDRAGDTISLPGWKVCNGNGGTPNLLNKFIRSEASSGNTGGSDDAIVVSHNHGGSVGGSGTLYTNYTNPSHSHSITVRASRDRNYYPSRPDYGWYKWTSGNTGTTNINHRHSINSHSHTISSDGVDGTGKNMPAYYSLIFIKKVS